MIYGYKEEAEQRYNMFKEQLKTHTIYNGTLGRILRKTKIELQEALLVKEIYIYELEEKIKRLEGK